MPQRYCGGNDLGEMNIKQTNPTTATLSFENLFGTSATFRQGGNLTNKLSVHNLFGSPLVTNIKNGTSCFAAGRENSRQCPRLTALSWGPAGAGGDILTKWNPDRSAEIFMRSAAAGLSSNWTKSPKRAGREESPANDGGSKWWNLHLVNKCLKISRFGFWRLP